MLTVDAALDAHLEATREARLDSYKAFLRIPSISAIPAHAGDCRAAAAWLAGALSEAGLEHAEVLETGGHPVVYADWLHAPDAPTVLIYGHYDVQPVDPLDLWTSPPFEPVVVGDRMLARGAADDKGQIHAHVMAAAAMLATRGRFPINVKYIFEGEEESSSVHLDAWLTAERDRLRADVAIISDSGFFEGNLPAITLSLRGIMYAQIDVIGTAVDLHSGVYGGAVQNPANALAQIIAALKGPDGRVRIPGFYDDVVPLTEADRFALANLPFDDATYQENLGVPALVGEVGYTTLERRGTRPTLDVNGMWAGFQGEGAKTIIPAHAHAKVSCRLVAGQEPDRIFEAFRDYVDAIAPPGVTTRVELIGGGFPSLTPMDHPATQAAARALEATFGRAPVYIREGGSIPVCASFSTILGLPVILLGITPPDENAHAPNEWMDLGNYETGIRTFARMLDELIDLPR
ncbi:MAG: dipeptidase [Thermomicrobiales bacterium]|jgi:acetylornithine deacetylase/succinyl-diaminopimelate desuccinylase-like protein|nr:MAG: dipeptidase [Thermomicrobiales bacterium]